MRKCPLQWPGRGTAHDDLTGVTYAEAREATAAVVRKLVKETTEQERLDAMTNVAVGKPSTEPGAKTEYLLPRWRFGRGCCNSKALQAKEACRLQFADDARDGEHRVCCNIV